jgi:chemotaxis-related protein WspB
VLLLSFHLGERAYAMPCGQILEIVPLATLEPVPGAPGYLAGQLDYRGDIVPVIDLRHLIAGEPCRAVLSTRIIVIKQSAPDAALSAIGLVAERVTETITMDAGEFHRAGVDVEHLRFLRGIALGPRGTIQLVDVLQLCDTLRSQTLTSPELRELLLDRGWS